MKKLGFIILMFFAFNSKAQRNLILNGNFEYNITSCYEEVNVNNGSIGIDFAFCFGYQLELHKDSCEICLPNIFFWGGSTRWKLYGTHAF